MVGVARAIALLWSVGAAWPALSAEPSPSCAQARSIVAEVEKRLGERDPDHAAILKRLATARDLCPALGLAWKYSYCSAKALGQDRQSRIYQDRAILNGVDDLNCAVGDAPSAAPPPPGPVRDKFALVIGIGSFKDERINRLQFPAKDAEDLRDFLVSPSGGHFRAENVFLLVDQEATRAAILLTLQKLFNLTQADDLVLVYVSSHGSPRQDGLGLNGVGYIVTWDTNLDSLFVDSLDLQKFAEMTSLLKARRKVTFLDTCYSGEALRQGAKGMRVGSFGVAEDTANRFLSGEGSYVVTSSSASEQSWESAELKNSFFTYYLIEALKAEGEPPTLGEVFALLAENVSRAVAEEKGAKQTPQILPKATAADLRIGVIPLVPP